jgi:CRP-like cAMP-binding protein
LIDRIRQDIYDRLEQLLAEVEKLRRALAALDPREKAPAKPTPRRAPKPAQRSTSPTTSTRAPRSVAPRQPGLAEPKPSSPARTASGATKAKVLGALSTDSAMTAGEVAKATGLGRGSVSTTLARLAKSGEVAKAERGYRLSASGTPTVPEGEPTEA